MLASQFVPPRAVERAQVRFTALGPGLQVAVPRRRPHRHRRPRPRRRRPLHLLPVLMRRPTSTRPARRPSARPATRPRRGAAGGAGAGRRWCVALGAGRARERRRAGGAGRAQAARDRSGTGRWRSGTPCRTSPTSPRSAACATSATGWSATRTRAAAACPLASGPATTVPPDAVRPTLRAPTADEPLRVYIGGDSIIRDAGDAFLNLASDSPLFETTLHYENATGLTRPDFYDWPAALRRRHGRRTGPRWRSSCSAATTRRGSSGPDGEALRRARATRGGGRSTPGGWRA